MLSSRRVAFASFAGIYALSIWSAVAQEPERGYQPNPPATWEQLGETYFEHLPKRNPDLCATGQTQSPIRIPTPAIAPLLDIQFDYRPYEPNTGYFAALNDGHTIRWYLDPDEYIDKPGTQNLYARSARLATEQRLSAADQRGIIFDGRYYKLLQMHVHHPSEHVLNGLRFPLEAHFVHKATDSDHLVVVAVMLEGQPQVETWYQWLEWQYVPLEKYGTGPIPEHFAGLTRRYHLEKMLPAPGPDGKRAYVRYEGSLTTPPCSGGVTWIVMTTPFFTGQAGVDNFKKQFGVNARPLQPLNGREVLEPQ